MRAEPPSKRAVAASGGYDRVLSDVVALLESARRTSVRAVNAVMTATYWEIGRRIVDHQQRGDARAGYGEQLLVRLSADLKARFGRGFGVDNLQRMRVFYQAYPPDRIYATLSRNSSDQSQNYATVSRKFTPADAPILQTPSEDLISGPIRQTLSGELAISESASRKFSLRDLSRAFPLPWSHYVCLLSVENAEARKFYETEALRGGWSVRQLDRQISTLFFERTLLSRNKAAMLRKGAAPKPEDAVTPEEEIKDPLVLEFLGLKDEYSESELEEALIDELERFLLELGGDFAFVGRQRRLRIDDEWYRVDLLFFHRRLRCLVVIDLKAGKFTHADAGQMHMYLNYAREHWTHEGENPPVGLILCTQKKEAVARYSLEGLPNKVLAAQYKMTLPDVKTLAAEIERTRAILDRRRSRGAK
jgi:predicted nuclease of restriction endonuclease-like (RecB) superfamily